MVTYDANNGRCFDPACAGLLSGEPVTWLADESETAYPFHTHCAAGAWPMSAVEAPTVDDVGPALTLLQVVFLSSFRSDPTLKPDEQGRAYPNYDVVIRRAVDGVERTYRMNLEWHASSLFWWEDGNGACDCNRSMDFERAGGMTEAEVHALDHPCSDGAFLIVRFDFPDGTSLAGPDAA